ncbi:MAG: 4-hydroxy-tetrahydrodipicolinate synthase [Candidatus Omnitrophica bacterium]|nr:4-hydroxy-tetrahydrodipicolinate synthase [Candidatus Omnitrophota bacterium]
MTEFKGSIVALVTPFTEHGVDEWKLAELIEFQLKNGIQGIVPCGTTGESPTLSHEEHDRVIEIAADVVHKRVPVIAGTGSNSTAEAVRLTRHAEDAGADAALVVTPYYNKPTQTGLYLHFKAVADSVKIPIILYNIEGRCARNIETETVKKLVKDCKNIIGVKEASGNLTQAQAVKEACGKKFTMLSGDDALTIPMMKIGGVGVISVVANIVPKETSEVVNLMLKGKVKEAEARQEKLMPLIKAMFIETNPIPVKTACGLMGLCSPRVRLPMCEMEPQNLDKLKKVLREYNLIND